MSSPAVPFGILYHWQIPSEFELRRNLAILSEHDVTLPDREFATLLRDKTFVDYLNVFLNLPIFSQRVVYKYSENDFEFDPPLKRTQFRLDRRRLVQWLLSERVPLFLKTDLYLEYTLCKQLLQAPLLLCDNSHNVKYGEERLQHDITFLRQTIGHVMGMRKFRVFLEGTPGQKVLQFWLDAEHFWKIPARSEDRRRNLFREIQAKYFKSGGALELPENEKWRTFTEAINFEDVASQEYLQPNYHVAGMDFQGRLRSGSIYGNKEIIARNSFNRVQEVMLVLLKRYWLPRYIIHCRREAGRCGSESARFLGVEEPDLLNIASPEIREILQGLERTHEQKLQVAHPEDFIAKEKNKLLKMSAMFPHFKSDCPSYANLLGEVVDVSAVASSGTGSSEAQHGSFILSDSDSDAIDSMDSWQYRTVLSQNDQRDSIVPLSGTFGQSTVILDVADNTKAATVTNRPDRRQSMPVASPRARERTFSSPGRASFALPSPRLKERKFSEPVTLTSLTRKRSPAQEASPQIPSGPTPDLIARRRTSASSGHSHRKDSIRSHKLTPASQDVRYDVGVGIYETNLADLKEETSVEKLSSQRVFDWLKQSSHDLSGSKLTPGHSPAIKYPSARTKSISKNYSARHKSAKTIASEIQRGRQIAIIRGLMQSKLANCQRIAALETETYYAGVVCYRRNNAVFVSSIAADRLAGHPLERYLKKRKQLTALNYLHFWQDSQTYLSTKPTELDNLGEHLKLRRAKILLLKYIHPCGENRIELLENMASRLTYLLPVDEGDDILRHAQDIACQILREHWRKFVLSDMDKFTDSQKSSKGATKRSTTPTTQQSDDVTCDVTKAIKETVKQSHQLERPRSRMQEEHVGLNEERMFWALHLAQHASHLCEDELSLGGIQAGFHEDDDYGSLNVTKPEIIRNKTLRDYIFPPKIDIEKIKVSKDELEKYPQKAAPDEFPTGAAYVHPFLKPIRRNGIVIERPRQKPKAFIDLLRDPYHLEFLKRFLQKEGNEIPIMFWIAVDDMRKASSGKVRQAKVIQIVRKYFSKAAGKGASLCCDADIIKEIPNMEKVTPSMLISAQVCVAKSLEERWWGSYGETFSKETAASDYKTFHDLQKLEGPRKWSKEKTRSLWIHFVRSVANFRRGILNPCTASLFREYLRTEAASKTEPDKKPTPHPQNPPSTGQSGALRRVIKNRIVSVDKLTADLNFLIEVDRFRLLVDTVMSYAEAGVYSKENEALLAMKAKAIIECYIDSDIPPKLQINISNEIADTIMYNERNQVIERGLFHEATISIFPTLAHLWKKFCKQRVSTGFSIRVQTPSTGRLTPHASKRVPDYISMNKVKTKKIVSANEDDYQRILFSIAHGVRYVIPASKDDFGSKRSGADSRGMPMIGIGLHPADSATLVGRLTGMLQRGDQDDEDDRLSSEMRPSLMSLGMRRKSRRISSVLNGPVLRKYSTASDPIAEEKSTSDVSEGGGLASLFKFMNPDAVTTQ